MKRLLFGSTLCALGLFLLPTQQAQAACVTESGPSQSNTISPSYSAHYGAWIDMYAKTSGDSGINCNTYRTNIDNYPTKRFSEHAVESFEVNKVDGILSALASATADISKASVTSKVRRVNNTAYTSSKAELADLIQIHSPFASSTTVIQIPVQFCSNLTSEFDSSGSEQSTIIYKDLHTYNSNGNDYANKDALVLDGVSIITHPINGKICRTGYLKMTGNYMYFSLKMKTYTLGNVGNENIEDDNGNSVSVKVYDGEITADFTMSLPKGIGLECSSASGVFAGCDREFSEKQGAYGSYIDPSLGFKHQTETDYLGGLLSFTRSYRSDGIWLNSMGERWSHSLDRKVNIISSTVSTTTSTTADVLTESGGVYNFREESGGMWIAASADIITSFSAIMDGSTLAGYLYITESDAKEYYDTDGKIIRIEYLGGGSLDFVHDASDRLASVTDEQGLSLTFGYNSSDEISSVVTPNGSFIYSYDGNGNLSGVIKPDGKTLTYHYENTSFVNALTGITDEENIRFVTYGYDIAGQATSTVYAGGVGSYSMSYGSDGTTTVTNSLNQDEVYHFTTVNGVRKPVLVEREATANVLAASKSFSYDVNGFMESQTDWNGNSTDYVRDSKGLVTLQTEAVGTGAERITGITYETNTRQRDVVSISGKTTDYDYDADGRILTETVTDTATSETRITTYTYHSNTTDGNGNTVLGKTATMDGARTDLSDVTSYTYDSYNRLIKITNALGHETQTFTFDSADRPLTQLDENNVQTTLTYDTLGRLATSTKASAVTSYTYDAVGNVLTVTEPNGVVVINTYDDARRLTSVEDSLGNTITYTLDNAGNRTAEVYKDSGSTLRFTQSQVFDTVSRLLESVDANLNTTVNIYDDNGNVSSVTDGNYNATAQAFDGLNRLVNSTDALSGQTVNSINALDQKTDVTDPRSNTTTYAYNAFGDVITQTSPDTGVTTFTVDKAGNILTRTDARGEVVTYTYDALNRLLSTSYASDSSLNVVLAYDAASGCGSSKGRLCSVTDASGTSDYVYDTKGLLTSVTETRGALTFTKSYGYDAAGILTSVTYPSGRVVTYGLNAEGQVSSVTDGANTIANSITYMPFGGLDSLTYDNGVILTNVYNTAYQLTSKQHGSLFYDSYTYDGVGNITAKSSIVYGYDVLNRLTSENSDSYTYDAIANRLTENVGGVGESYTYPSTSSILTDIGATSITTDAAGNITTDNQRSYVIDAAGHVESVDISSTTVGAYVYDSNNHRVSKTVSGVTTYYVYGKNGLLYGEYDNTGALIREYVWLGAQPLAQIDGAVTTYLHTDHLGTPRIGSNSSGSSVWDWDSDAFGNGTPTGSATVNLRFAGQYWDDESNLHYNWNRYYDPKTGRYISSDPIGLEGGLNTFAYVSANPVMFNDPEGKIIGVLLISAGYALAGYSAADLLAIIIEHQLGTLDETPAELGYRIGGDLVGLTGAGIGSSLAKGAIRGGTSLVARAKHAAPHIFGVNTAKHRLSGLLTKYKGNQVEATKDIIAKTFAQFSKGKYTKSTHKKGQILFDTSIRLKGYKLHVQGVIVNGKPIVADAWLL